MQSTRLGVLFSNTGHNCKQVYSALNRNALGINSHPLVFCRAKCTETDLSRQLKARIKMTGPVSVATYMKEVLTNPSAGYYMNRDVFGRKGDFTTSPEINQMFGELIGIWCVSEWMRAGSPDKLQVVELGPGRGTLAADMLRTFSQFSGIKDAVSLHLVEVSPKLSEIQKRTLSENTGASETTENDQIEKQKPWFKHCISKYGQQVFWYDSLDDIPRGLTFFVAHEFLDALPILKFQKTERGWREIFVDIDETDDGAHHFRYVLAANETMAQRAFLQVEQDDKRHHIEVSPESGAVTETIAKRIAADGGFSLLIDYGHSGEKSDTFRAFKNHGLHPVLSEPGTADVTADVDFAYLKKIAEKYVATHGPVPQADFLHNMGIKQRVQALMRRATAEQSKDLITAYTMLTDPKQMGERFKFLCLLPKQDQDYIPAGYKSCYS